MLMETQSVGHRCDVVPLTAYHDMCLRRQLFQCPSIAFRGLCFPPELKHVQRLLTQR